MRSEQASKRADRKRRKKRLIRRAKMNRQRNKEMTRRYGVSGHRQCGKKMRYPSEESANVVALRRGIESGVHLRVYRCPLCGGWHITHTERIDLDAERHS